jgi:hypothetical protein
MIHRLDSCPECRVCYMDVANSQNPRKNTPRGMQEVRCRQSEETFFSHHSKKSPKPYIPNVFHNRNPLGRQFIR